MKGSGNCKLLICTLEYFLSIPSVRVEWVELFFVITKCTKMCNQPSVLYITQAAHHVVITCHGLSFPQDIKETGRGLGLTVCQQGPSVIASLIATHIPAVSNTCV